MSMADVVPRPDGSGQKSASVLAFVADGETESVVTRVIPGGRRGADVCEGGIHRAIEAMEQGEPPAMLIVDVSDSVAPAEDMARLTAVCGKGCTIIALGPDNDVGLYRSLIGAGAADYLVKPVSLQDLRRAVLTANREAPEAAAKKHGRVEVIVSARGGVGGSSLAASSAWLLARELKRQVALVDFDLHFGTAALSFDIDPGSGLRNALEFPERIDSLFVASALVNCAENLYVLSAEERPDENLPLRPEAIEHLVDELREVVDVVLIDLPRHQVAACGAFLANVDGLVLVTDLGIAGLRDCIRLKDALERLAPSAPLRIVANRVGRNRRGELPVADFEKNLGRPLTWKIPEDAATGKATLAGKPVVSVAAGRTNKGLRQIARALAGPVAAPGDAGLKAGFAWMRKLRGR